MTTPPPYDYRPDLSMIDTLEQSRAQIPHTDRRWYKAEVRPADRFGWEARLTEHVRPPGTLKLALWARLPRRWRPTRRGAERVARRQLRRLTARQTRREIAEQRAYEVTP